MFYNGYKLLNMPDADGQKPEIFISEGNRSTGKTTFFNSYLIKRFIKHHEKFCLIYRTRDELTNVSDKFFSDIKSLFFPADEMQQSTEAGGLYRNLYFNEIHCGYAVTLSSANKLKKFSHLLNDTSTMLFDEFQTEDGCYLENEVNKLLSVHTSLARGNNKSVRYLPIIMIANKVSLINPYYLRLGISQKIRKNTKFMRGSGFVLERNFSIDIAKQQSGSGFNKAFAMTDYFKNLTEDIYLNDNKTFIETMTGRNKYIATIYCGNDIFSIREYPDKNVLYCDTSYDETFPVRIAIDTVSQSDDNVLRNFYPSLLAAFKMYFQQGKFRFKNNVCKNAIFSLLSY